MKIFSRSVMVVLLIGILLLSAVGCWEYVDEDWWMAVVEGMGYSSDTGNKEADAAIERAQEIPDYMKGYVLVEEARVLRNEGNLDEAAIKLDEAIKLKPDNLEYRTKRMAIAVEQNDYSTVENQRDEALKSIEAQRVSVAMDVKTRNEVPHPRPEEEYWYYTQLIRDLESKYLVNKIFKTTKEIEGMSQEAQQAYYQGLQSYYQELEYAYMGRYEANRFGGYYKIDRGRLTYEGGPQQAEDDLYAAEYYANKKNNPEWEAGSGPKYWPGIL